MCLAALLLLTCGAQTVKQGTKPARRDPEEAVRPIRALLAISEEPVASGASCDQGRLIAGKAGPQQVGDMLAVLLAYHDSGINSVRGSCEVEKGKDQGGEANCAVRFSHRKNSQAAEEFAIFKFKMVKDKAQAGSLQCELAP